MPRSRAASSACVVLVMGLGACESNEPPPDVMPQMPSCSSTEQVVADVDEVTPLGLSAREILDRHTALMMGRLEWTPRGDGYELMLSPAADAVDVSVSLAYEGGRIRFLDQEVVVPEGQVNDIGIVCPDELRVDVAVGLSTVDGALAESWQTTLVVGTDPETGDPIDPVARVDAGFAELSGTLAVTGVDPTTWSVSDDLRVLVEFSEGGSTGRVQTAVLDPEGRGRTVELGAWQASG